MFKKLFSIGVTILTCCILSGCSADLPENLKAFLSPINYQDAIKNTNKGSIFSLFQEFDSNNNLIGSNSIEFNFKKEYGKQDSFDFSASYIFEGNKIVSNLNKKYISLKFDSEKDSYIESTSINKGEIVDETISDDAAYQRMLLIFYSSDELYKTGGLYYGDYFSANVRKYSENYVLNNDNTLSFIAEDDVYYEGAHSEQNLKINSNGMLLYCKQKLTISSNNAYATLLINATY